MDLRIKQYLAKIGSEGGKARAARHDRATLSKWARLGGRPPKDAHLRSNKSKGVLLDDEGRQNEKRK
jgi:hypothetical protein